MPGEPGNWVISPFSITGVKGVSLKEVTAAEATTRSLRGAAALKGRLTAQLLRAGLAEGIDALVDLAKA